MKPTRCPEVFATRASQSTCPSQPCNFTPSRTCPRCETPAAHTLITATTQLQTATRQTGNTSHTKTISPRLPPGGRSVPVTSDGPLTRACLACFPCFSLWLNSLCSVFREEAQTFRISRRPHVNTSWKLMIHCSLSAL